jgi:hypothetical protein
LWFLQRQSGIFWINLVQRQLHVLPWQLVAYIGLRTVF